MYGHNGLRMMKLCETIRWRVTNMMFVVGMQMGLEMDSMVYLIHRKIKKAILFNIKCWGIDSRELFN